MERALPRVQSFARRVRTLLARTLIGRLLLALSYDGNLARPLIGTNPYWPRTLTGPIITEEILAGPRNFYNPDLFGDFLALIALIAYPT